MILKILVAGIGNRLRGDDGFGSFLAEKLLEKQLPSNVTVVDYGLASMKVIHDLPEYDVVIFLDAISKGYPPGTIYKVEIRPEDIEDLSEEDVQKGAFIASYHELDLDLLLAVAKSWNFLPKKVLIIGVEPKDLSEKIGLSEELTNIFRKVEEIVLEEIKSILDSYESRID